MIQHHLKSRGEEAAILEGRDEYKRIDTKLLLITKETHSNLRRALFHQPPLSSLLLGTVLIHSTQTLIAETIPGNKLIECDT